MPITGVGERILENSDVDLLFSRYKQDKRESDNQKHTDIKNLKKYILFIKKV